MDGVGGCRWGEVQTHLLSRTKAAQSLMVWTPLVLLGITLELPASGERLFTVLSGSGLISVLRGKTSLGEGVLWDKTLCSSWGGLPCSCRSECRHEETRSDADVVPHRS